MASHTGPRGEGAALRWRESRRNARRGSGSGVAVEQTVWQATRFDHGKMVRFTGYGSRADAIEAEGLAE
jgi:hypothetical protein